MATTYEPSVVLASKSYEVVGTRPIRHSCRSAYGAASDEPAAIMETIWPSNGSS